MTSIIKVDQIQNAAGTAGLTIDSDGVLSRSVIPAWRVGVEGDQSITTTSSVTIPFDETSSSENCFLSGGCTLSGGIITVPKDGIYQINGNIRVDQIGSGYLICQIRINGATGGSSDTYAINGDPPTDYTTMNVHSIFKLQANDEVEIKIDTSSDASYHVDGGATFSGAMIG